MLVLKRKESEIVMIGDDIRVMLVRSFDGEARLGFEAPAFVPIHRKEIYDQIKAELSRAIRSHDMPALLESKTPRNLERYQTMKFPIEKIAALVESGEPLFILRARDNIALRAIAAYLEEYQNTVGAPGSRVVSNDFTKDFERNVIDPFVAWRDAHPGQCKNPD